MPKRVRYRPTSAGTSSVPLFCCQPHIIPPPPSSTPFPYTTLFRSSLDDGPAAMRYTECRLDPAAVEMTTGLDEDVVDFVPRSEEHTSELQSRLHLVCRRLLQKK